jgi:hypothetical protein
MYVCILSIGSFRAPEIKSSSTRDGAMHTIHRATDLTVTSLRNIPVNDGAYAPNTHGCSVVS